MHGDIALQHALRHNYHERLAAGLYLPADAGASLRQADLQLARRPICHLNAAGHGLPIVRHRLRVPMCVGRKHGFVSRRSDMFEEQTAVRLPLHGLIAAHPSGADGIRLGDL